MITFGNTEIEKLNFTAIKVLFFKKMLILTRYLLVKKTKLYKYVFGYLYDDYKKKALHIMLPKMNTYVKSYDGQTKLIYILINNDKLLKNIMLFGIKSVLVLKKNLIVNLSIIKDFWKPK